MSRPRLLSKVPNLALAISLLLTALGPLPPPVARAALEPTAGPALPLLPAGMIRAADATDSTNATSALPLALSVEKDSLVDHTHFTASSQRAALQPCVAPAALDVSGPDMVYSGTTNTYTATVLTADATLPISYTWEYYPELAAPEVQVLDATQSVLSLTSSVTGTRPITVTAENCGGAITTVGEVIVQDAPLPDLVVTDVWPRPSSAFFQIQNTGQDTAAPGYTITLEIDGSLHQTDAITVELAPGERFTGEFGGRYVCSGLEDKILATVDAGDLVAEEADDNNRRDELWRCDTQAPEITSGPAATVLGPSSAAIEWETNEDSDSTVHYSQQAGEAYDNQEHDATLTQSHYVTLTGLSPGVYHYEVASADASSNEVTSGEFFFEILPEAATPLLVQLLFDRKATVNPIYAFSATVENWQGADRVDFYVDGELSGTDYSPVPIPPGDTAEYHLDVNPVVQWTERPDFFQEHEVEVVVVDYQDNAHGLTRDFHPVYEDVIVELDIVTPQQNDAVAHTEDVYLPDPSNVLITVKAVAYKWYCDVLETERGIVAVTCPELTELLTSLDVYVYDEWDNMLHSDSYTPAPGETMPQPSFTWNAAGESPGLYRIRAVAVASDGSAHSDEVWVRAVYGEPSLDLSREVILNAGETYATVRLTLSNDAEASATVYIDSVTDWVRELQPVEQEAAEYTVSSTYISSDRSNRVNIACHMPYPYETQSLALDPGQQTTIEYQVVPILYPTGTSTPHIGTSDVEVRYSYFVDGATYTQAFSRSHMITALETDQWLAEGDYILVTNPGRLLDFGSAADRDALLSTMAHLSAIRRGVLGYQLAYGPSRNLLDELVEIGGNWATAMHIYDELFPKFYLLIVGEKEIVPAWTEYDLEFTDLAEWDAKDYEVVPLSDQPYAMLPSSSQTGEYPQVRVGRVVGNDASALREPLLASIAVAEGTGGVGFDRSHAFILSGEGHVQEQFRDGSQDLYDHLDYKGVEVTYVDASSYYQVADFAFTYDDGDQIACGDVDGDGLDEIVIADASQDRFYIMKADGTELGSFQPEGVFGVDLSFDQGHRLAAGDVLGDDDAEILFKDWDFVYIYDQAGVLQVPPIWIADWAAIALAVGDVDGNGQNEIVLGGVNCGVGTGCVYGCDSDGTLEYVVWHDFHWFDHLAVGDVIGGTSDADAGDEIIVADESANRLFLYSSGGAIVHQQDWLVAGDDLIASGGLLVGALEQLVYGRPVSDTLYILDWNNALGNLVIDSYMLVDPLLTSDGLTMGNVRGQVEEEVVIGSDEQDRIRVLGAFFCGRIEAAVAASGGLIDHDVLFYSGHGLPSDWGCGLSTDVSLAGFGSTAPVAFGAACLTGDYQIDPDYLTPDVDYTVIPDYGIVEHILGAGAAVYIGATQVSVVADYVRAGERFDDLWGESDSAGDAFFELELGKWDWAMAGDNTNPDRELFWIYEYNAYGDPKFGAVAGGLGSGLGRAAAQAANSILTVDVPSYTVTIQDGSDWVEIPDGGMLIRDGQPIVPYWPVKVEYPAGEVVHDVVLLARSEPTIADNLHLPYPNLDHMSSSGTSGGDATAQTGSDGGGEDWVPDRNVPFDWTSWDNPDGTSTLLINVYPAFYNRDRAVLEFHQHFTFAVETISSSVFVQALEVDQHTYPAWGDVGFSLWLANSSARQDVIVSATVRRVLTGELVQGLSLRNLHDLGVRGHYRMSWDSSGAPAGRYFLDVELRDLEGKLLDQAAVQFRLGERSAKVTSLTASPTSFLPGQAVDLSMTLRNTGSEAITGTAIIRVQTCEDGEALATFSHSVENLAAGAAVSFDDIWDTTGAEACCYTVLGYLSYDSKTTDVATVIVEQVGSQALLALSKSDRSDPVPATWWVHYDIALTNNGEGATGEVLLTDIIPEGMYFVDTPANEGWTPQGGVVTRRVTSLLPGASVHFPLVLGTHSSARGTVTNTVVAEWGCAEVTATESTTIGGWQPPLPCPDPYEPNESLEDAWRLVPGSHWSYICCGAPADDDYFRFTVEAGEQIDLRLSQLPDNYELCLIGPDGAELQCSTNAATTAEDITHVALVSGEYYARVYGYRRTACDSTVPYKLDIGVIPAVVEPTPTATPTATVTPATPTPTATPPPSLIYLPLVMKNGA